MRSRLALLVALGCLVAGCSNRDHSNPFDPANPQTRGRPVGFAALAGNQLVMLQWQPTGGAGVLGFELSRRLHPESSYVQISDLLPTSASQFNDFGLINGVEHSYRLYYVLATGLAGSPAEDAATPGPLRPWVTDFSGHALLRLTPDNRHVAFSDQNFTGPAAVAVDRIFSTSRSRRSNGATRSLRNRVGRLKPVRKLNKSATSAVMSGSAVKSPKSSYDLAVAAW